MPILQTFLDEYRSAQAINEEKLLTILAEFQPCMDDAYRHLVSIGELEADKANLKPILLVKSSLRDIGDIIESSLFPFMRLRLKVVGVKEEADEAHHRIDDLSLGATVAELLSVDRDLYCPTPFEITLSQWRNIAYHSDYKVVGDTVICEYGHRRPKQTFECSVTRLLEIFRYVDNVYYLHKVAYEIFCTDNIQSLARAIWPTSDHSGLSEFTTDAAMAYSIVASGFCVLNAARKRSQWAFVLLDRHNRNKSEIKLALQEALVPYLLHRGPTEINAWVDAKQRKHFISFRGELRKEENGLTSNEGSLFRIGRNFRVKRSAENSKKENEQ